MRILIAAAGSRGDVAPTRAWAPHCAEPATTSPWPPRTASPLSHATPAWHGALFPPTHTRTASSGASGN